MTLTKPLRFIKIDDDFYKLDDGGPTDCIYLALHALYDENFKPDLIVSGINLGSNMGEDVSYSGTASGAMEGVLHDIPSIAISQVLQDQNTFGFDFTLAKETIASLAKKVLYQGFPLQSREFLNINIPLLQKKNARGYKLPSLGFVCMGMMHICIATLAERNIIG